MSPPAAPLAATLARATPLSEHRTGLQRVRVLRAAEGHLWCRSRGPHAPPDEPAPARAGTDPVLCLPERVGDEDVFRMPGPESLATAWFRSGPATAPTLAVAGVSAVRAAAGVQVAVARGSAPAPDTVRRLRRWCAGADLPGDAGRLRRSARRSWPGGGLEELARWADALSDPDRPVALHGGLSLGTTVHGSDRTGVLTGAGMRAGAAELDLGGLLGELLELELLGGAEDRCLTEVRSAIASAWPHRSDPEALARAAVLRVAGHAVDFATYVGWVPDLSRHLALVTRLAEHVRRDPADFVGTVLTPDPRRPVMPNPSRPAASSRRAVVTLRPRALDEEPDLVRFLDGLGLGGSTATEPTSFGGRNDNWAWAGDAGQGVFAKKVPRQAASTRRGPDGFDRSLAYERCRAAAGTGAPPSPVCLGGDPVSGTLVFELVRDARSGLDLAVDDELDEAFGHAAGRAVALTHAMPHDAAGVDTSPPFLPALDWLEALPWEVHASSSMGELEALRLMQADAGLGDALRALRRAEAAAPAVPSHCDLRLDQLLVTPEGAVLVVDWEEFRLADAARDVGSFAGELLSQTAYALGRGEPGRTGAPTAAGVVDDGVTALTRRRPVIEAFCAGYREIRELDRALAERAAGFAGWHLFERMYVSARERARVPAAHRALAGVGRAALERPDDTARLLGLSR